MSPRNARIGALLAFLAVVPAAYWWWTRPQRQIRAIFDDVAAAPTYDRGESGLVMASIARAADRWVVSIARASPVSEPLP